MVDMCAHLNRSVFSTMTCCVPRRPCLLRLCEFWTPCSEHEPSFDALTLQRLPKSFTGEVILPLWIILLRILRCVPSDDLEPRVLVLQLVQVGMCDTSITLTYCQTALLLTMA